MRKVRCPNCGQKASGDYCQWCNYPILRGKPTGSRKAKKQAAIAAKKAKEAEVLRLNKEIPNLVWNCYVSLYAVILRNQGWDEDKSRQEAINTASDFLKHFGY